MEGVSLQLAAHTPVSSSGSPPNLLVWKTLPGTWLSSSAHFPQGHYKVACSAESHLNVYPQAQISLSGLLLCQKTIASQGWL